MEADLAPVTLGLKLRRLFSGTVDVFVVSIVLQIYVEIQNRVWAAEEGATVEENLVSLLLFLLYLASSFRFPGKTLGMMIAGLRLIDRDGNNKLRWGDAVARGLGLILTLFISQVSLLIFLFSPYAATIQDQLAATKIVANSRRTYLNTPGSA